MTYCPTRISAIPLHRRYGLMLYNFPFLSLRQGNYSIVKAPDEYTIEVAGVRGIKEFQFDRIFLADSSQSDVFEDTDVSSKFLLMYSAAQCNICSTSLVCYQTGICEECIITKLKCLLQVQLSFPCLYNLEYSKIKQKSIKTDNFKRIEPKCHQQ